MSDPEKSGFTFAKSPPMPDPESNVSTPICEPSSKRMSRALELSVYAFCGCVLVAGFIFVFLLSTNPTSILPTASTTSNLPSMSLGPASGSIYNYAAIRPRASPTAPVWKINAYHEPQCLGDPDFHAQGTGAQDCAPITMFKEPAGVKWTLQEPDLAGSMMLCIYQMELCNANATDGLSWSYLLSTPCADNMGQGAKSYKVMTDGNASCSSPHKV